jgi:hypothetical protein
MPNTDGVVNVDSLTPSPHFSVLGTIEPHERPNSAPPPPPLPPPGFVSTTTSIMNDVSWDSTTVSKDDLFLSSFTRHSNHTSLRLQDHHDDDDEEDDRLYKNHSYHGNGTFSIEESSSTIAPTGVTPVSSSSYHNSNNAFFMDQQDAIIGTQLLESMNQHDTTTTATTTTTRNNDPTFLVARNSDNTSHIVTNNAVNATNLNHEQQQELKNQRTLGANAYADVITEDDLLSYHRLNRHVATRLIGQGHSQPHAAVASSNTTTTNITATATNYATNAKQSNGIPMVDYRNSRHSNNS